MSHTSSSSPSAVHLIPVDPRVYCETMNELHSYITSSKRGYLTQAELFRYYRQRHDNAEIPYRLLGYRSLLDLLSSDQRLFAIDLRREPAYVYSAVKLRQEKRDRRRGTTSFSRQHHSTNTLDDQHSTYPDYFFFDHHLPLNEQDQHEHGQEHSPSFNEQQISSERTNFSPSTPDKSEQLNINHWQSDEINERTSTNEKKLSTEENNEEKIQFVSTAFFPLGSLHLPSDVNNSSPSIPCENVPKLVQRKILSNDGENPKRLSMKELSGNECRLNRSISTSTTSLVKSCSFQLIDLYLFLCTLVASFVFLAVILYKVC